jgi:hypothetical protein
MRIGPLIRIYRSSRAVTAQLLRDVCSLFLHDCLVENEPQPCGWACSAINGSESCTSCLSICYLVVLGIGSLAWSGRLCGRAVLTACAAMIAVENKQTIASILPIHVTTVALPVLSDSDGSLVAGFKRFSRTKCTSLCMDVAWTAGLQAVDKHSTVLDSVR